jgi:hypothetical protein
MMSDEETKKIRDQIDGKIRQFGGQFEHYLVIVSKPESHGLFWKSNNTTWAVGAATRYLSSTDEMDRVDEREQQAGEEER